MLKIARWDVEDAEGTYRKPLAQRHGKAAEMGGSYLADLDMYAPTPQVAALQGEAGA
jgi:hypothetical protein